MILYHEKYSLKIVPMNYHYNYAITTNSPPPPAARLGLQIGEKAEASRTTLIRASRDALALISRELSFMQLYCIIVAYNAGKRAMCNDQDFSIHAASIRSLTA